MRRSDDDFLDPEAVRALAVIDATLAGDPVEPEDADLAELTLILAGQRPAPGREFSASLDARVAGRFSGSPPPRSPAGASSERRPAWRRWLWAPGPVAGAAAVVGLLVVLSTLPGGGASGPEQAVGGAESSSSASAATPRPGALAPKRSPTAHQRSLAAGGKSAAFSANGTPSRTSAAASASSSSSSGALAGGSAAAGSAAGGSTAGGSVAGGSAAGGSAATIPAPPTSGRQVIQSAQISLSTRPDQVDAVSQQVFNVVADEKGYVQSSTVTATGSAAGYAEFQLSVPSVSLQATMTALSRLHGAAVVSRTDSSQDVTADLGGAGRRLADARALRTSLLRQLAAATTTTASGSLKAQIRDAEASIASDLATLNGLHHKVDNSQIAVTLNASLRPGHRKQPVGGFTLHKAAHDAGRVLVVAAGVALIALAVLVPLALVAALGLWIGAAIRRRRREQALDLV